MYICVKVYISVYLPYDAQVVKPTAISYIQKGFKNARITTGSHGDGNDLNNRRACCTHTMESADNLCLQCGIGNALKQKQMCSKT
jgi:hypothetical protein